MIERKGLRIGLATMLAISMAMVSVLPAAAQDGAKAGNEGQEPTITTIGQLEKLYPVSLQAEKAIVHEIPPVSVIIDRIAYKPEEVALFNGLRLRFTSGKDGQMYAFTTVGGLEKFLHEQRGQSSRKDGGYEPETIESVGSSLYQHIWFLGTVIDLTVNQGNPDLGSMNNQVSSLINLSGYETVLFDDVDYGGDYFYFSLTPSPPFYFYWELATYGWNDRANSAICFSQ